MVEHVEHFHAELHALLAVSRTHMPVLYDGEVHVIDRRSGALPGASIGESAQLISVPGKRERIKPLIPWATAQVTGLAEHAQRPSSELTISPAAGRIAYSGVSRNRESIAAGVVDDGVGFPPADHLSDQETRL